MDKWIVEPLGRAHKRSGFCCGQPALDNFLRSLVSQYEKRRLARTYVATRQGEQQVMGYYTLASGSVSFENLPATAARKLPRHPVPVVLLARLAVDQAVQGKGLGGLLLDNALKRCRALAGKLGIHAVEVDAIDQKSKAFYEKFGFVALLDNALHLYLPIRTIEDAFGDQEGQDL